MTLLDVVTEDDRWDGAHIATLAERATVATLSALDIAADQAEITLLACNDARIAELNAEFREKPTPTNVLSWPAEERAAAQAGGVPDAPVPDPDGTLPLGDIAISFDTCQAEAADQNKSLHDHTLHLIVHGILHLLGYDHIDDADATRMENLEISILCKLGIDDPY